MVTPDEDNMEKYHRAIDLMDMLGIPYRRASYNWEHINVIDLYNILIDEEKLRILVSKLKLKAFW